MFCSHVSDMGYCNVKGTLLGYCNVKGTLLGYCNVKGTVLGYCNVKGTEFVGRFRKNHCLNFVTSQKYALTLIFVTLKVTQISQCCFFFCGVEIIKSLLDKGMSVNWTDTDFLLRYIFLLIMVIWKKLFLELRNFRFKKILKLKKNLNAAMKV